MQASSFASVAVSLLFCVTHKSCVLLISKMLCHCKLYPGLLAQSVCLLLLMALGTIGPLKIGILEVESFSDYVNKNLST